jgi:hypothetical protein
MFNILLTVLMVFTFLMVASLQHRFSSETTAGWAMGKEKGHEIAPNIFPNKNNKKSTPQKQAVTFFDTARSITAITFTIRYTNFYLW